MGRPATKTPKSTTPRNPTDGVQASPALEQLAQARSTRWTVGLIIQWMQETEKETAQRHTRIEQKLDQILSLLGQAGPAGELSPQLSTRLERHHKELINKVDRLGQAVEQLSRAVGEKVLTSDAYTIQAIDALRWAREDIAAMAEALGVSLARPAMEPRAMAVGDEAPAAIVLVRAAA